MQQQQQQLFIIPVTANTAAALQSAAAQHSAGKEHVQVQESRIHQRLSPLRYVRQPLFSEATLLTRMKKRPLKVILL